MKTKRLTLIYLVTYLAVGGLGFLFFPKQILQLFLSDGQYGEIMPRLVGMFMCALSFLIYRILKNEDWQYYSSTIYIRSLIVLVLLWLYSISCDPMFLILTAIVLIGLVPSIIIHLKIRGRVNNNRGDAKL